jgi:hypothetical protein
MLIVTIDVDNSDITDPTKVEEYGTQRLDLLKEHVGEENVPADLKGDELAQWGLAKACRRIITNKISDVLNNRNGVKHPENEIFYNQLVNFHYRDGAKMLSIGGVLYERGQSNIVGMCDFGRLSFMRNGEEPYVIRAPRLTLMEVRHLNKQLPIDNSANLTAQSIPQDDLISYAKIYKYFPTFVEAEL